MHRALVILFSVLVVVSMSVALANSAHVRTQRDLVDAREKELQSHMDSLDSNFKKHLVNYLNSHRSKRSDIDTRLMELQAKIDLVKAFKNMPAGHGKFDFEQIGKRNLDLMNLYKLEEQLNE